MEVVKVLEEDRLIKDAVRDFDRYVMEDTYRNRNQDDAGDDLEGSEDIGGELQRKAAAEQRAGGRAHLR